MAQSPLILQPGSSRAHQVAQGVLCALAGACVTAAVWAFAVKHDSGGAGARNAQLAQMEAELLRAARPGARDAGVPVPSLPTPALQPAFSLPATPAPAVPPSQTLTLAPSPSLPPSAASPRPAAAKEAAPKIALPLDKQLKNPQAMEAVMAARAMRQQGDMQAAIEALKSADLREPDHPEILGEMALTYEEMGIASRSEPLWRQIYTMGEAAAGGYFTLAASKIGNRGATATEAPAGPGPVTLGACRLSREPLAKQGERITVRVPVLAKPGATIDPSKIEIHVTLYESVDNGARIEPVPQDKTAQSWSTIPLDWREAGGEAVDVVYDLFAQRQGAAGARSFHGYAVKLFYQNKLAGGQAQPESLREGAQRAAPAGLDNALFPK